MLHPSGTNVQRYTRAAARTSPPVDRIWRACRISRTASLRSGRENAGMFFVVDPDKEVAPQHEALVWQRLWEMRDLAPISAVLPAAVSSPCPLLPNEAANAVLVATLTQVPS